MNEHYPRVRRYGPTPQGEQLLLRQVVRIVFYMPHDHYDLAAGVSHALDVYLHAVGEGPETLSSCWDTESDSFSLDENGWRIVRNWLRPRTSYRYVDELEEDSELFRRLDEKGFETCISLSGGGTTPSGYSFHYEARLPWRSPSEHSVSELSATVPTEYLEEHGPGKIRELALEMASHLRFSTGHVGLAFEFLRSRRSLLPGLREEVFRYPGLDVPGVDVRSEIGTRVDGVHWLNFLGQPVLGEVGGAAGLRARLHSPETTVQALDGERVAVTLGQWPQAGDLAQGRELPAYRELARVLEPWLHGFLPVHVHTWRGYTEEEVRRWWRRFLD
jgi:hypothetical protein